MGAKAPRSKRILIQPRRSAKTGETYYYGDFRPYADVGGKVEPLRAPDARTATTDPVEAARLYAERVTTYETLRTTAASPAAGLATAVAPSNTPAPTPERIRLAAMVDLPLARKALPRSGRRASTVERDKDNFLVIRRILGDPYVDEITPTVCDDYVLAREKEPGVRPGTTIAARTIINELHSLSNLMKRAVAMGFVAENPVRRMSEKPAVPADEADYLTTEEAARLLDAAAELDDQARRAKEASRLRVVAKRTGDARRRGPARELRKKARRIEGPQRLRHPNVGRDYTDLEVFIAFLLYTGARLTEALGLQVSEIDFAGGRVCLVPNKYRLLKHRRHHREVPLWPPLEMLLRDYFARTGITEGLVFPGRKGGMLVGIHKAFRRCVAKAGLDGAGRRVSPHTLRHTFATMGYLLRATCPRAPSSVYWRAESIGSACLAARASAANGGKCIDKTRLLAILIAIPSWRSILARKPQLFSY